MTTSFRILIAGSTGYLGSNIVEILKTQHPEFSALARNKRKLLAMGLSDPQVIQAQVTNPEEIRGICEGFDIVISCIGITRQQDGLGYMDVDYQANLNLLEEAERSGVSKFIYISAFNAQNHPEVRLLKAKEKFARRLLQSTKITPCVIRPNGFFSDIAEVYSMAMSGRVFTFGKGWNRLNPIDGEDLGHFCLEAINRTETELAVGGPDTLSVNEITRLAFSALDKPQRVIYLPDLLRKCALVVASLLPEKWGGPAEFFLTMLGQDNCAPSYGSKSIEEYFGQLAERDRNSS